ncbi:uncharacterized protein [Dysidea avara]|uniref:uncharacterized protein n=1 Tax=Dysidea avara TaxID=196820 RepID=UPI00331E9241
MLLGLLLSVSIVSVVNCGYNNLPQYNPEEKTIECNSNGDFCHITLVIEALESMSYFQYENGHRKLQGFRAFYNHTASDFDVACPESYYKPPPHKSRLQPPIVTDGYFRPIFTINGQMPGPTIVANKNQELRITVYNELKSSEGIAMHWHGMHQVNTSAMDGVPYITQYPILPAHKMTYQFKASPRGTHWYHAHGGTQRTDGIYGALIVKDTIPEMDLEDFYQDHTLLLMDWTKVPSRDIGQQLVSSLKFWQEPSQNVCSSQYTTTQGPDDTMVGPFPFWSGIINDRGRHCDNYDAIGETCVQYSLPPSALNYFTVAPDKLYRFRLIGAQSVYAFKFSIQDHLLTVVATDGYPIEPIRDVNYVIVNTGERYDVVVNTSRYRHLQDGNSLDYWVLAETLEKDFTGDGGFYTPISEHKAEAILRYNVNLASSPIQEPSRSWNCTREFPCRVVNCPFSSDSSTAEVMNYHCINVHDFETELAQSVPPSVHSPSKTLFYNFDFYGEKSTNASSVDGINFRYPPYPPVTAHEEFEAEKDDFICPGRGCPHRLSGSEVPFCACTHQIDISNIPKGETIEIVISNINTLVNGRLKVGSSHSIHLHGHTFYVVKTGYPVYQPDGRIALFNRDLQCINKVTDSECKELFSVIETENDDGYFNLQEINWRNDSMGYINTRNKALSRKDTVIVPYGGYVVIRFVVDNPGWWFFHCHIEYHQLEGMAAVITELPQMMKPESNVSGGANASMKASVMVIGLFMLLKMLF